MNLLWITHNYANTGQSGSTAHAKTNKSMTFSAKLCSIYNKTQTKMEHSAYTLHAHAQLPMQATGTDVTRDASLSNWIINQSIKAHFYSTICHERIRIITSTCITNKRDTRQQCRQQLTIHNAQLLAATTAQAHDSPKQFNTTKTEQNINNQCVGKTHQQPVCR